MVEMARLRELLLLLISIAALAWWAHSQAKPVDKVLTIPGFVIKRQPLANGIELVISRMPEPSFESFACLVREEKVLCCSPPTDGMFVAMRTQTGPANADLLGNGHSQLLLEACGMGNHNNYTLFDLESTSGQPQVIFSQEIEGARLLDYDGDGRYEIVADDPDVGPREGNPKFFYRCESDGLHVSPSLSGKIPPPTPEQIEEAIAATRKSIADGEKPSFQLTSYSKVRVVFYRLLYSGRSWAARLVLEKIWDHGPQPDLQVFLGLIKAELDHSKIWPQLRN